MLLIVRTNLGSLRCCCYASAFSFFSFFSFFCFFSFFSLPALSAVSDTTRKPGPRTEHASHLLSFLFSPFSLSFLSFRICFLRRREQRHLHSCCCYVRTSEY